jgi:(1->4)-alpha-D-glucan 1-alpha-D-glucosylmutase
MTAEQELNRRLGTGARDFAEVGDGKAPPAAVEGLWRTLVRGGREAPAAGTHSARNEDGSVKLLSTYRLQLGGPVDFAAATSLLPYLRDLGISHLYLSPILEAQAGSSHGYDVTSFERFDPVLGSAQAFDRLAAALRDLGMGLILDFVPNHMGIGGSRNGWWLELLEQGQAAPSADIFDVDWTPPRPELRGKILVPLLADTYEKTLARGELQLKFEPETGRFDVWYFDHRLPLRIEDYGDAIATAISGYGPERNEAEVAHLRRLAKEFSHMLPDCPLVAKRAAELRRVLSLLAMQSLALSKLKEAPMTDASVLGQLMDRQHYRLADWRQAATLVNYRRFFDINQLIAVRMERPSVFARCHEFIGQLIAAGKIQGLRIDHIDGLADPGGYCRRLRRFVDSRVRVDRKRGPPDRFYIFVEKILGRGESLRSDWPVDGTTGYDFIALLNEMFVDPGGAKPMQRIWERFVGRAQPFEKMLQDAKGQLIDAAFAADLDRLVVPFRRLAAADPATAGFGADELRAALRRVAVCFQVYRSYVAAGAAAVEDRRLIDRAVAAASRGTSGRRRPVYGFLKRALKGEASGRGSHSRNGAAMQAPRRFQQFSAPVMAKGMEDTVFYRHLRLLSLNEVGGDPRRFGSSTAALHRRLADRVRHRPRTMLATATHDTKRGEDSRARLNQLSEIPAEWSRRVRTWARLNAAHKARTGGRQAPTPADEYLLYQALVGAWPHELLEVGPGAPEALRSLAERMKAYFVKALREAKLETSWLDPDPGYEQACLGFLEALLDCRRSRPFLDDMAGFVHRIAPYGALNSLCQTTLKLTAPGLPDIYQGTELWDFSLVDPDNRRPVDFPTREQLLHQANAIAALPPEPRLFAWRELAAAWPDGRIKLQVILSLLSLRRTLPELFARGDYRPLSVRGDAADHVFAFRRRLRERCLIAVVGRLFHRLRAASPKRLHHAEVWRGTKLRLDVQPGTTIADALTGRRITADCHGWVDLCWLFDPIPMAVLIAVG